MCKKARADALQIRPSTIWCEPLPSIQRHKAMPDLPTSPRAARQARERNPNQACDGSVERRQNDHRNLLGRIPGKPTVKRLVGFRNLRAYRELNSKFDDFVLSATARSNSKAQQRRYDPGRASIATRRDETNDFYKILGMVPTRLPSHVRDDIAQSIVLALLEGLLQRDQVSDRVQQFVRDQDRMFPTKFAKFGDSALVSLDEVVFDGGTSTRGDTVSRGLWD